MKQLANKSELVTKLRRDILERQGYHSSTRHRKVEMGLGQIEKSFPNGVFPVGCVHELVSHSSEQAAAASGFMAAVLGKITRPGGMSVWISTARTVFAPGLKCFGVDPDRVIFIDVKNQKDLLWITEQCLKCQALSAVITELKDIGLTESRRLQLAVEQSRVTGLMHRINPSVVSSTAAAARWRITPVASTLCDGMPGVGFFRWHVELLKVRNGEPGSWDIQWMPGHFTQDNAAQPGKEALLKAG
ncbi:Error-prone repair protein ImuA [Dyadobacter luteus]|uniref:Error-prone repair protein ImuA n=1 Tax=Dyadobacter luteus TaxID=2259619 RepID=A0A3D8Y643_9BACT|nr:Error-prone repair protein ImuA [Dyadobacter luteus]REA58174.1 Error-prone repair protein ImuA [Dyadobacter luteus]